METKPDVKRPSRIFGEYYVSLFFVMVLAFIGNAAFVLKPMLDTVKEANAQTSTGVQTLESERLYLASLDKSIAAAQSITPETLEQVDRAFPKEVGLPELLVFFDGLTERNAMRIEGISFAEDTTAAQVLTGTPNVSGVTVNLVVSSPSYVHIKRFLSDLESSIRIFDVQSINVSTGGESASYSILLKTYVYSPPASTRPTPVQR